MKKTNNERFQSKTSPPDENGCINWIGGLDKNGYGRFKPYGNKRMRSHRYAYQEAYNEIPEGYCVCHHCDNPTCVNPKHLFLGTNQDNTKDRSIKGRSAKNNLIGLPFKLLPNSKLTKEEVLKIRKLIKEGKKQVDIAKMFNVHRSTILYIKKRRTWYHI
jgi:hypothetical protein